MCDMCYPFCYENSLLDGKHGDILNVEFINNLNPYTELAIGGGNPLSHPNLILFLNKLKEKNIIANMTVNQKHFIKNQELLSSLIKDKLIYGLGVSLVDATNKFIDCLKKIPNAIIHIINGVVALKELEKLYDKNLIKYFDTWL